MIVEGIEIGSIYDGGCGDVVFEARSAKTKGTYYMAVMYQEEFAEWTAGKASLDDLRDCLDEGIYKTLKKLGA
jgi:hypothetical protein